MELSENVIAIFDDLAKRFGVVIDWSKDNVLPYLLDIFSRWRTYEIIVNAIPFILLICLIFIVIKLYLSAKKEKEQIRKELSEGHNPKIYDYKYHKISIHSYSDPIIELTDNIEYAFMFMLSAAALLIMLNFFTICALLQAIFVPEMLFYDQFLD